MTDAGLRPYPRNGVTVAVCLNLADGVILGADTLLSLQMGGATKAYPGGEKVFPLGNRPIGIATYGHGAMQGRTIPSFIGEFVATSPIVKNDAADVGAIAESLRAFMAERYLKEFPATDGRPLLGLVVAGFSPGQYQSEVWNLELPHHMAPGSAIKKRGRGELSANWWGLYEPIDRYFHGFAPSLLQEVTAFAEALKPMTDEERARLKSIFDSKDYQIPMSMLPLPDAIDFVRFLINLVIDHHRFEIAAAGVGGRARIGVATYKGGPFRILED